MDENLGLPKREDGLYAPNILVWNWHAGDIMKRINKEHPDWDCSGSVDDLTLNGLSGVCGFCEKELIRLGLTEDGIYFAGGIIYCPSMATDSPHPKQYWLEVWPDLNNVSEDTSRDVNEELFRASNPIIKPCYVNILLIPHRILEGNKVEEAETSGQAYDMKPFPEPHFRHP